MVALLFFALALLASPFKSKRRLEAENAALQQQLTGIHEREIGTFREFQLYIVWLQTWHLA